MWFDILKDSKQVSRTMGSIDWENEEIPEETDDDCLSWIKELGKLIDEFNDFGNYMYEDFKWFGSEGKADWLNKQMKGSWPTKEMVCEVIDDIKRKASEGEEFAEDFPYSLEGSEEKYGYPIEYRFCY